MSSLAGHNDTCCGINSGTGHIDNAEDSTAASTGTSSGKKSAYTRGDIRRHCPLAESLLRGFRRMFWDVNCLSMLPSGSTVKQDGTTIWLVCCFRETGHKAWFGFFLPILV